MNSEEFAPDAYDSPVEERPLVPITLHGSWGGPLERLSDESCACGAEMACLGDGCWKTRRVSCDCDVEETCPGGRDCWVA